MKLSKSKRANVNYLAKIVDIKKISERIVIQKLLDLSVVPLMVSISSLGLILSQDYMYIFQQLVV